MIYGLGMSIIVLEILCVLVSIPIGLILFLKPACAIEMQRKFYEKINWKIEPISMPKEIRNTKIMGISLFVLSVFYSAYIIIKLFC